MILGSRRVLARRVSFCSRRTFRFCLEVRTFFLVRVSRFGVFSFAFFGFFRRVWRERRFWEGVGFEVRRVIAVVRASVSWVF